jgi:translation initiation factor IF-3
MPTTGSWRACASPSSPPARPGCHRKPWSLDGPRGGLDYGGPVPESTEARAIEKQHRINEQIRITPIRVISAEGGQLGIIPTEEALGLAREAGLDLVEVAPNEKPPVCRIMDFGKFKYQQKKKQHKTHVHHTKIKEIRLRPKTGEHDIEFKVNQAKGFLQHKDKVIVSVVFRGRELAHIDEGRRVMKNILEQLDPVGKVESPPQQMGRRLVCTLTPK